MLTRQGLPTVVAKRALGEEGTLVGRAVESAEEASAEAANGANLLLLSGTGGGLPDPGLVAAARKAQRSKASIPLLAMVDSGIEGLSRVLQAG